MSDVLKQRGAEKHVIIATELASCIRLSLARALSAPHPGRLVFGNTSATHKENNIVCGGGTYLTSRVWWSPWVAHLATHVNAEGEDGGGGMVAAEAAGIGAGGDGAADSAQLAKADACTVMNSLMDKVVEEVRAADGPSRRPSRRPGGFWAKRSRRGSCVRDGALESTMTAPMAFSGVRDSRVGKLIADARVSLFVVDTNLDRVIACKCPVRDRHHKRGFRDVQKVQGDRRTHQERDG